MKGVHIKRKFEMGGPRKAHFVLHFMVEYT